MWLSFVFPKIYFPLLSCISVSSDCTLFPVADLGFPRGGVRQPRGGGGANLLFDQYFPKTAWKWRHFGPEVGARVPCAPLRSATDFHAKLAWVLFPQTFTACHFPHYCTCASLDRMPFTKATCTMVSTDFMIFSCTTCTRFSLDCTWLRTHERR